MNERLSAFMDGEASRDEADAVVSALLRDEILRNSWSRHHWVRASVRAQADDVFTELDLGFGGRVMHAIAEDPASETVSIDTPALTERSRRVVRMRPRRWRGVAGMSMAAAVAGVVLMSNNPFVRSGGEARVASAASGTTSTRTRDATVAQRDGDSESGFAAGGWNDRLSDFSTVEAPNASMRRMVASVSSAVGMSTAQARPASASSDSDHWSVSDPAVRSELNGYLVDHNGMARGYGMSSTTPGYVRMAAYGQSAAQ